MRKPKNLTNQFLQTRLKTLDWQTIPQLTQILTSVQFGKATEWPFFFDMTKLFLIILLFLMYSFLNNTAIASQQTWAPVYHILIHPGMIQIQMLRLVFHYVKMWFQIMVLLVVHIKSLSTCFFSSIATISKGCEFSWRGAVK